MTEQVGGTKRRERRGLMETCREVERVKGMGRDREFDSREVGGACPSTASSLTASWGHPGFSGVRYSGWGPPGVHGLVLYPFQVSHKDAERTMSVPHSITQCNPGMRLPSTRERACPALGAKAEQGA